MPTGSHTPGPDVWNPADAIHAAARYLHANGAPGDYPRAILTYNHSRDYVATVLRHADSYRAARTLPGDVTASAAALLANPRLHHYNPAWSRGDLQGGATGLTTHCADVTDGTTNPVPEPHIGADVSR